MLGQGSQSDSENGTLHAQTSRRKSVFYILFERIIKLSNLDIIHQVLLVLIAEPVALRLIQTDTRRDKMIQDE